MSDLSSSHRQRHEGLRFSYGKIGNYRVTMPNPRHHAQSVHMGHWPRLLGQDGWILAISCLWTETEARSINLPKKNEANIQPSNLVNKGFILWLLGKFFLHNTAGGPSEQDSSIMPARVANHSTGFGSSCPLTEINSHIPKSISKQNLRGNQSKLWAIENIICFRRI